MNDPPLRPLMSRLGYTFADEGLLQTALTHRSFANESRGAVEDNQRLEFLGDAVIGLVVSERLVRMRAAWPEGRLSKARAALVNAQALAGHARGLGLGELMRLGRGEVKTGGREKDSVLGDAFEAVLGAVLLDGGFAACERVLEPLFDDALRSIGDAGGAALDAKTSLQERLAAMAVPAPNYEVVATTGPPHDRTFTVAVAGDGDTLAIGSGPSKKVAEQRAAAAALRHLARSGEGNERG